MKNKALTILTECALLAAILSCMAGLYALIKYIYNIEYFSSAIGELQDNQAEIEDDLKYNIHDINYDISDIRRDIKELKSDILSIK